MTFDLQAFLANQQANQTRAFGQGLALREARLRREEEEKEREIRAYHSILGVLQLDPTADIDKLAAGPGGDALSAGAMLSLREVQKGLRKRQKESEAAGGLDVLARQAPGLGAAAAGTLGPTGQLEPPPPEVERAGVGLQAQIPQLGVAAGLSPEAFAPLQALFPAARASREQELREQAFGERRAEARGLRMAGAEARIRADVGRAEQAVAGLTPELGALPEPARRAALGQVFPGESADRRAQIARELPGLALLEQRERQAGAQGISTAAQDLLASEAFLRSHFPDGQIEFADGHRASIEPGLVAAHSRGLLGVVDLPVLSERPLAFLAESPKQRDRLSQISEGVQPLLADIDESSRIGESLAGRIRSGELTGLRAPGPRTFDFFQRLARFGWVDPIQGQDPEVAAFENLKLLIPSSLLKLLQGSRPSDFDFMNFIALHPIQQEIGTPSYEARLNALRRYAMGSILSRIPGARANPLYREYQQQLSETQRWVTQRSGRDPGFARATSELRAAHTAYRTLNQRFESAQVAGDPKAVQLGIQLKDAEATLMQRADAWSDAGGTDLSTSISRQTQPQGRAEIEGARQDLDRILGGP